MPSQYRVMKACTECGREFWHRYRKTCSTECQSKRKAIGITTFNRSDEGRAIKMGKNNPVHKQGVREKISQTMISRGHSPKVRGGNGRGPTKQEEALAKSLGWDTGLVVSTRINRPHGAPTHYKVDVASRDHMIAIEIDGQSHRSRSVQEADARKTLYLESQGWTVLRFTNKQVTEDLEECVQMVMSTISK